ncbi:MAG: 16S rRNA (cytidine(1402)-2'-O)-methyltransferase [Pseudomonadota bacterium]|nr:MAG: 16S rRNA (cytidine(1402)-2'-O)-methyltransferase [Pseudomonadota bacterium]
MSDQPEQNDGRGTLWIVATPIGNRADLGDRARQLLSGVAVIAAEDTRVSRRLLVPGSTSGTMVSLHEHNETRMVPELIERLASGDDVALVSDAGTPLISDPGYRLVNAAHDAGLRVRTVPGPCAAVAALSVSGLACDRFYFEGFLPARSARRRRRLSELAGQPDSKIFYAPARDLVAVLADLADVFGPERQCCLARELTKRHETVQRLPLGAMAQWVADHDQQQRGEAVLVVAGSERADPAVDIRRLAAELKEELPPSRAARVLARATGLDRQAAWTLIEAGRVDDGAQSAGVAGKPSG